LLEPLVLVGEDAPCLFRRPEVAARRALEVRQTLAYGSTAALDRGRDGHRIDGEHGRGSKRLGAFALGEKLVEKHSRFPRAVRRVGRDGRRPVNA